jgi:hypothetical protein
VADEDEEQRELVEEVVGMDVTRFPACQKCNSGVLLPLSDYGQEGATVTYKAWACTNPECGFSIRIDKGEVTYGRKIQQKQ